MRRLALPAIVAVAALVHLYRLDLILLTTDQVRDLTWASDIATGTRLPLLGPAISLTQASLGPLYYYLLAVPVVFSPSLLAGAYFIAASNVAAVAMCFVFAERFFSRAVAVRAAALFAVFPLAVISSRGVSNIGFLPPAVVGFVWALSSLVVNGNSRAFVPLAGLLAVVVQLHLAAGALGLVALIAIVLFRPRVRVRDALAGLALFLLLFSPYLYHEVSRGFPNVRAMARFTVDDQGISGSRPVVPVVLNALSLYGSALDGMAAGYRWPPGARPAMRVLHAAEALLFVAGVVLCAGRLVLLIRKGAADQARAIPRYAILLLWLAVPVALLAVKKTAVFYWYLDLLYPSQFIFAAIALAAIPSLFSGRVLRTALGAVGAGLFLAVVASQTYFAIGLAHRIDQTGELIVQGSLDIARPWWDRREPVAMTLLPLGFRAGILRALLADLSMPPESFSHAVHGAVLGGREENAFLLRHLAARGTEPARPPDPAARYLVTRDDAGAAGVPARRSARIGPYSIVEYRSPADLGGWRYAVSRNAASAPLDSLRWTPVRLPASDWSVSLGADDVLLLAGTLRPPPTGRALRVGVSVTAALEGGRPLRVSALRINDRPRPPARQRGQYHVLFWVSETLFDVDPALPGPDAVVISVNGPGLLTGLDVYEGASLR